MIPDAILPNAILPNAILQEMRISYSVFISENVKDDKKEYYYKLINSIPDEFFNTKNPFKLRKAAAKLSCFFFSINNELKGDGYDLTALEKEMKEITNRYKKAIIRGII